MKNNISVDSKSGQKQLVVPTPKGNIVVTTSVNTDSYPGIYIDFVSDDIKDSSKIYSDSLPLAMVEYNVEDKSLQAFIWGNAGEEDFSHKIEFNDSLIFNEDFNLLEKGTKVLANRKVGFITGDDRDNCPDGYASSLHYYIKYSNPKETYEEVKSRICDNDENWYDDLVSWDDIYTI